MKTIHTLFSLLFLSLSLILGSNSISLASDNELPIALSGNIVGDTASTRFFIDFDKSLPAQTFYMDQPNRIIIDLGEAEFDKIEGGQLKPRGLVTAIQVGRISQGRSRIVLTLSAPSEIIKASMSKRLDADTYRFLLDIDSTDDKTFATLLDQQRKTIGDSGLKAQKGDRLRPVEKQEGKFIVVLDPGHGGIDGGATGQKGTQEKEVVLIFAKMLEEKLEASGAYDVQLTREDDTFLSLRDRLNFNRRLQSDLFISIHADSLRQKFVRGSTIYTLSKRASDQLSASLAESENSVDLIAGLALEEETEVVNDILVDLTTRETTRFSRKFSDILLDNLRNQINLIKNPQRSASFGVLKAPEVPSVLLELGYLSNVEDEKLLSSVAWKDKAAQAVSEAVIDFFKYRTNK